MAKKTKTTKKTTAANGDGAPDLRTLALLDALAKRLAATVKKQAGKAKIPELEVGAHPVRFEGVIEGDITKGEPSGGGKRTVSYAYTPDELAAALIVGGGSLTRAMQALKRAKVENNPTSIRKLEEAGDVIKREVEILAIDRGLATVGESSPSAGRTDGILSIAGTLDAGGARTIDIAEGASGGSG